MKRKHQRLFLAGLALLAIAGAALLALSGLKDSASFYCAPSDIGKKTKAADCGRLGGMVQKGSVKHGGDGLSIRFLVTDGVATVPVSFHNVTPDLFREGSGVVAEGKFLPDGSFAADNILAKHDERYMPPQMAGKRPASEAPQR